MERMGRHSVLELKDLENLGDFRLQDSDIFQKTRVTYYS